jgi:hypothetical protein
MMLATLVAAALAASPYRPLTDSKPPATHSACAKEKKVAAGKLVGQGVANLPFAMGKTFSSLDEYLNHLECFAAPIDKPWWKQIRPGVYEHVKTATHAKREIATRAELMKRFGFSR